MPTYLNAYELLREVRLGIGEYSDAILNGLQRGTHTNRFLMGEINKAQKYVYNLALSRLPNYFIGKADLTGVDSVFTLPADFGTLIAFKNDKKTKLSRITVDNLSPGTGSKLLYYQQGKTLVLERSGITDTYELWYRKRPRDIHAGRFLDDSDDDVGQIYLDTGQCARLDDYYNGMIIENTNRNEFSTASDFVGTTGVVTLEDLTLANDWAKGEFYGVVSELPEALHVLIGPRAILSARTVSPVVKSKPTKADFDLWNDLMITTFQAFTDQEEDVDIEEIFSDFAPHAMRWGIVAE